MTARVFKGPGVGVGAPSQHCVDAIRTMLCHPVRQEFNNRETLNHSVIGQVQ